MSYVFTCVVRALDLMLLLKISQWNPPAKRCHKKRNEAEKPKPNEQGGKQQRLHHPHELMIGR
jgi:hypothetical protein